MTGYAKNMMVEITEGGFAGQWGKLDSPISTNTWLVRLCGHGLLEFTEKEFTSSKFHNARNERILSKHNNNLTDEVRSEDSL